MKSLVDTKYLEHIRSLSGKEKIQKSVNMLDSLRAILKHKVKQNNPKFSDKEILLEVTKQMYTSDKKILALLTKDK